MARLLAMTDVELAEIPADYLAELVRAALEQFEDDMTAKFGPLSVRCACGQHFRSDPVEGVTRAGFLEYLTASGDVWPDGGPILRVVTCGLRP